jgi:hypothetical protein
MEFSINDNELAALYGLPHIQQLAYLRGIRPYMDVKTGLVGIKRGISYQSIAEQLHVEAHPGIKGEHYSRTQTRRALPGLIRMGLISVQSEGLQLILKCELASRHFPVQNKVVTDASQQADTFKNNQFIENKEFFNNLKEKVDIGKPPKVDTPLKDNNYIYLLSQFEKFWNAYPEKKSKSSAWETFQKINPSPALINSILQAVDAQIKHRDNMQLHGTWVPPWKYPSNWLLQQCWEDAITTDAVQETKHAKPKTSARRAEPAKEIFWVPDCSEYGTGTEDKPTNTNVIQFKRSS